jgi:acetylglutamate kinase
LSPVAGSTEPKLTESVLSTLGYVRQFAGTTLLVKLGGAVLEDSDLVHQICADLQLIRAVGVEVVLVHGGGPAINAELTARGITWEFHEGQRITSPQMMDVIEMTLCGKVNRRIVRALNLAGVKAVGISGADARTLFCKPQSPKLGLVGAIQGVDGSAIRAILKDGGIPVVAPVGVGKKGEAYNINADWAAARIAEGLGIEKLLFLTDQDGILNEDKKLIPELDAGELEGLIERQVVSGGMLAKTRTIVHALRNGVKHVHVLNARRPHGLVEELFTDRGVGTACRLRSRLGRAKAEATNVQH